MFPRLQTLVLYSVPEMSYNDLGPYLTIIPFIKHVILKRCSLKRASSLICSNLLGHDRISQLQSCILYDNELKSGIILHEPIPLFYQVQSSLIDLRIYMEDFISLKNLLQFVPKLSTLGELVVKH
jgi:hypothetical protein